jgi:hypothetical protein
MKQPNISTISHQISNAHLEICQTSLLVYIPVFQQRLFVTSQDFIKFWGNFFAFVLYVLIEFSQGFKTF